MPFLPFAPPPVPIFPPQKAEAHLWRIDLTGPAPDQALLSGDEKERLKRFHFIKDQNRFLITHGATRQILASYLSVSPQSLEFETGAWGKPSLRAPYTNLQFNLSHSQDWALLAITNGFPVGVDLEFHKTDIAVAELAQAILSPAELLTFSLQDKDTQRSQFFAHWTAKEAFLKSLGTGLQIDPRCTEVSFTAGTVCTVNWPEAHALTLLPLSVAPSYSAALCTPAPLRALKTYAYHS
jgi:4'-phosphopantetheinyl transferase